MPTVALHTLGCKLNHAETQMIGKQFLDHGFSVVDFGVPADVVVLNTCSVTERAERECRQLIRRSLRSSADTFVVVTGCYAQLRPEEIASIDGVDVVLGAKEKFDLFKHAPGLQKSTGGAQVFVSDIRAANDFGPAYSTDAGDRTRAYLKIQDGCDFNCSFCTIPMARGGGRSQSVEECVSQAGVLVNSGYREIVLTGVNVGDYGRTNGFSLLELLRHVVRIDGLERIRISSIEPNLFSDELLEFVASEPRICRHFHIPLQSGHDEILRSMRRRYTTNQYRDLVMRISEKMSGCGIGADVIVGFPGETDAHFEGTCTFLDELPVSYLHVFTYSERPDTPAATHKAKVPHGVRSARNETLRMLSRKKKTAFHRRMVGQTVPVLLENTLDDGQRFGLTDNYVKVGVPQEGTVENSIVDVTILDATVEFCSGDVSTGWA